MILTLILVVLLISLVFGGWGGGPNANWPGYYAWSPFGLIVLILIVLLLTGHLL